MGKQRKTIRNRRKIGIDRYQNPYEDPNESKTKITKNASREIKLTIFSIFVVTITMISSAYAIFSSVQKSENYNTLTVGTLKIDFNDTDTGLGNVINLNGAYPESDEDGQAETPYSFKITNSGTISAKYTIKILDDSDMIESDGCQENLLDKTRIKVSINGEKPFILSEKEINSYIISSGTLSPNNSKTYNIRMWITDQAGNEVLGKHYHGKIIVESENLSTNSNISIAYTYNEEVGETYCITGEETTCQQTTCYKNKVTNSCNPGTIIKYKVNENEEKYFYVLHDDGETITMQQRENTVSNHAWYIDTNDNTKGPLTILPVLENATTTWTNVNDQTYTMGTTIFSDNAFTGCTSSGCTVNTYTLDSRTAKARMIDLNEATKIGCSTIDNSCPIWMYNYLSNSTNFGGTASGIETSYWTMSALSSTTTHAWLIYSSGKEDSAYTTATTNTGARAVITINK